jgi:GNAT superfamily N-acetyltransferase
MFNSDIVVSDCYRGNGLGKIIIEQLVNAGKQLGCYEIILACA